MQTTMMTLTQEMRAERQCDAEQLAAALTRRGAVPVIEWVTSGGSQLRLARVTVLVLARRVTWWRHGRWPQLLGSVERGDVTTATIADEIVAAEAGAEPDVVIEGVC